MKLFTFKSLLLICTVSVLISANAENQQTITYKNQRGSTMTLIFQKQKDNTGIIKGTFTSAVGNCKVDVGQPMPLIGSYNGNAIAINVNFIDCKTVAAMTGNISSNFNKIKMLWLVAQDVQDPTHANWNSNIIGTDHFKRVKDSTS